MHPSFLPRVGVPRSVLFGCVALGWVIQLLSGCDGAMHDHAQADAGGEMAQETVSENGTYRISYVAEPTEIPFNASFELHTEIVRADGINLADDVEVQVDASMPAHNHGMNTAPSTMATGEGTFHTLGMLFHMEGRWEITVDITENGSTERATFQVDIAP